MDLNWASSWNLAAILRQCGVTGGSAGKNRTQEREREREIKWPDGEQDVRAR